MVIRFCDGMNEMVPVGRPRASSDEAPLGSMAMESGAAWWSVPLKVLLSPRRVVDALPTVMEEPTLKFVPLIVPREPVRRPVRSLKRVTARAARTEKSAAERFAL